jgi:hypothetical protein
MFNRYRDQMFNLYNSARNHFIQTPSELIEIEKHIFRVVCNVVQNNIHEIIADYNEASFLYPFWGEYPPENRGRSPVGDQIPWLEVGEHAVGHKIKRYLQNSFSIREIGIPTGPDDRYLVQGPSIALKNSITNSIMLFLDTKSVGPRDDKDEVVVSPNQVSGDGIWNSPDQNIINTKMIAKKTASHDFFPAVPPLFVFSNNIVAPVVHIYIKPIYKMLHLDNPALRGQPLSKIRLTCVPNGLLLTINPNYIKTYPGLLYPGKDDKSKNPRKLRCRIDLRILKEISPWRDVEIVVT